MKELRSAFLFMTFTTTMPSIIVMILTTGLSSRPTLRFLVLSPFMNILIHTVPFTAFIHIVAALFPIQRACSPVSWDDTRLVRPPYGLVSNHAISLLWKVLEEQALLIETPSLR